MSELTATEVASVRMTEYPPTVNSRTIEWPPGSGAKAVYSPDDERVLRGLLDEAESGKLDVEQFRREVQIFHDLKVHLGATVVADLEPADDVSYRPDAASPFQIPPAASSRLAAFDPQTSLET